MLKVSLCFRGWAESRKHDTLLHQSVNTPWILICFNKLLFFGKIFNNPQEVLVKTRTGNCQTQDTSLSKARGKYLFCLTLEVIQFAIDLLRWVPLLLGQKLILSQKISGGSSSGSSGSCCPWLPVLSLCERLLVLRHQATNSSGQGMGSV